ncbi:hypothetical protein HCEG_03716 [Histoplasma capsulatum var. duboisii H88]|uniref:Uncharacterized protein n=1 Tax=Ajellomyces capsulatus (strain H88) TaxID=544711 RepID=F0UDS8_AJEC8|nr:hypothetical protein HCEG_03716 [Histoplasma capsulatum var. duboisii H88]
MVRQSPYALFYAPSDAGVVGEHVKTTEVVPASWLRGRFGLSLHPGVTIPSRTTVWTVSFSLLITVFILAMKMQRYELADSRESPGTAFKLSQRGSV